MDFLFDDSRDDKPIEDYLFSGNRLGTKYTSDKDQQFAKPIEDEDLFGGIGDADDYNQNNNLVQDENETRNRLEDVDNRGPNDDDDQEEDFPIGGSDILCERDMNSLDLFGGEIIEEDDLANTDKNKSSSSVNERSEIDVIDDIFVDDYSQSPEPMANRLQTDYSKSKSNNNSNQAKSSLPAPPTPAQIKIKQMREKLLAQARAMSLKPRKLGTGFDDDGTIEVTIEQDRLVSNSNSKFIFNKLFNKSKKAADNDKSPENQKKSWIALKESMRKRICHERRKVWDSFQKPVDDYDEEEEIVGISTDEINENAEEDSNDVDPFEVGEGEAEGESDIEGVDEEDDAEAEAEGENEVEDEEQDEEEEQEDQNGEFKEEEGYYESEEEEGNYESEEEKVGNKVTETHRRRCVIIEDDDED